MDRGVLADDYGMFLRSWDKLSSLFHRIIMENQMEKKMENEMEYIGFIYNRDNGKENGSCL